MEVAGRGGDDEAKIRAVKRKVDAKLTCQAIAVRKGTAVNPLCIANAEAAIVAWSLVSDRGGILLPANLHSPIRQAGAVVKSSKNQEAARYFLRFLVSPEGRKLFESHGFTK